MTSVVQIFNMALGAIGQSETVASIEENSKAARVCRTYYEICRDQMLSDFDWPFATKLVALADIGLPQPGWQFRYRYPVDCLKARELLPEGWYEPLPADQRIRFQVGYGETGRVINTDQPGALLIYTVAVGDTQQYSPMSIEALAMLLASKIAMPLAVKGDLAQMARAGYIDAVQRAQVHAFSETQQPNYPYPDLLRARG